VATNYDGRITNMKGKKQKKPTNIFENAYKRNQKKKNKR